MEIGLLSVSDVSLRFGWLDSVVINKDFRGREIVYQVVRSAGSVCANMEEGYRRGIGTADFVRIMRTVNLVKRKDGIFDLAIF